MSLILDALKKSEQQRQREKTPNLQSIHQPVVVAAKKTVQPWWWLVAFIVVCNFAFFGYWFWREQNAAATVAQTAAIAEPVATQSAEKAENPAQSMTAAQRAESTQTQAEFTRISPRETPAQSASTDAAQRIEEINELPDAVRNNLPAMTFSFHVYSETPEQRTIIINDRRVREGDEVSAGLRLQSITPDGVILLFEQHRIHISVLSDW